MSNANHAATYRTIAALRSQLRCDGVYCSKVEQNELAEKAQAGDRKASETLYRSMGNLAIAVAFRVWRKNTHIEFTDLMDVVNLGYMESLRTYERWKGNFATHAYNGMFGYARKEAKTINFPDFGQSKDERFILDHMSEVRAALNKYGTDDAGLKEVSEEYGLQAERLRAFSRYKSQISLQSLAPDGSGRTLEDTIIASDSGDNYRDRELIDLLLEEAYNRTARDIEEQYGKKENAVARQAYKRRRTVLDTQGVVYRAKGNIDLSIAVRKTKLGIVIDEGKEIPVLETVAKTLGTSRQCINQIQTYERELFTDHLTALLRQHTGGTSLSL